MGREDVYLNVVYLFPYDDIPSVFKRYITYKAAGRAATQMVTNSQLVNFYKYKSKWLELHVWNMNVIKVTTTCRHAT
ncbi:MAG: hypothetical protein CM15mV75_200 [uncultured marine virus]|nr:MAG: hypothetical protein CM15mV75_200 [uncultured marine virus]